MGASENFCLRWNDFESSVTCAFQDLRAESDFFDISLTCDGSDGRTLQAHKVILSACSSFFKQMLRSQSNSNPLIYLRGVKLHELESVLDFMYHGEVNVAQEDLNSFLAVAEDLQIKGLTQQQSSSGSGAKRASGKRSPQPGPSTSKRLRRDDNNLQRNEGSTSSSMVKQEQLESTTADHHEQEDVSYVGEGGEVEAGETLDENYGDGFPEGEDSELLDTSGMDPQEATKGGLDRSTRQLLRDWEVLRLRTRLRGESNKGIFYFCHILSSFETFAVNCTDL